MDNLKLVIALALVVGGVVAFYALQSEPMAVRIGALVVTVLLGVSLALTSAQGRAAIVFARGADIERRKVVWPSHREAAQVTLWVICLVVLVGLYLWLLDAIFFWVIYDLIIGV